MLKMLRSRREPLRHYELGGDRIKASSKAAYRPDPEKKKTASRAQYQAEPEKKKAACRAQYQAEPKKEGRL